MHSIPLDEKLDWFRVIVTLERSGYSHLAIAHRIGVARRTIGVWKMGGRPRWEDGQRLLDLWFKVTKGQETAPTVKRHSYLS